MLSSFLQKLLFVNQFDLKDGKIQILGNRYIMINAESISALQEIDKDEIYNASKKSSTDDLSKLVKHANVYRNMKNTELKSIAELSKKIGKTDDGIMRTLETIFEIYGLGDLNIVKLDNSNKTALLKINDSTIALAQKETSKSPVCAITAGILAGIFSFVFGKDVDCVEKKCKASGAAWCEFNIQ